MPYEIDWYLEAHILLVKVVGDISHEEFHATDQLFQDYLNAAQGSERVHVLFDDSLAGKLPHAKDFTKLNWLKHPKVGWIISFGARSTIHRFFAHFVTNFFGVRARALYNLEDALAHLQQIDPDLKSILAPREA